MLNLTFNTDNENLIQLSRDYWSLDSNNKWVYKTTELGRQYSINSYKVASIVREVSDAFTTVILCSNHGCSLKIESRAKYEQLVKQSQNKWQRSTLPILCSDCQDELRKEQTRKIEERKARENQIIDEWLNTQDDRLQPQNYASASLEDAFLLYAILSSAGHSWHEELITARDFRVPPLFARDEDSDQAYLRLYRSGWITPSRATRRDALTFNEAGEVSVNLTRVVWKLAPDMLGTPYEELPIPLEEVLRRNLDKDFADIWRWVSMSELRAFFEEEHGRLSFQSRGWITVVEQNLRKLLDEYSLGVTKQVIYHTFKHISYLLRDSRRTKAHVYNMIPGCLLRTPQIWQEKGWTLYSHHRNSIDKESVVTGLLFDSVFSHIPNSFGTLNGTVFDAM
jgi:hypothetical protein